MPCRLPAYLCMERKRYLPMVVVAAWYGQIWLGRLVLLAGWFNYGLMSYVLGNVMGYGRSFFAYGLRDDTWFVSYFFFLYCLRIFYGSCSSCLFLFDLSHRKIKTV